MARAQGSRQRSEPRFEDEESANGKEELRLSPEDRRSASRRGAAAKPVPRRKASREERAAASPARRRGGVGSLIYWSLVLGLWGVIALIGVTGYFAMKLPPIDQLTVPKRPPNVSILAADGTLIANRGETGGSNIPIGELPSYLPRAFVAIEDHRFYRHFGIDPMGLARALVKNVVMRRTEQGGSTLTQQLAKNLFLTPERSLSRKAQEALLALWLERNYSKDQILELYMNRVYFGSGAYGVEAAAQKYFGKSARAVSLGEAAVLGGLVQSPSRLAPNRNPVGAAERAALVLAKMVEHRFVTAEMAKLARTNTAEARRRSRPGAGNYAADWIMDLLDDHIGAIETDVTVKTTIDTRLQAQAQRVVSTQFDTRRAKLDIEQMALVAMTPEGAVRAMIGGRDYAESQFNRAVAARRQPGSSFKPFVYLTALEKGLTPDSVREDSPVNIRGWKPENYTHEYFGAVTLTRALAMSLNTVAVKLNVEVGPRNVVRTAQRLGIHSPLKANESLALGTSEVSPIEMAGAYAAFANGGIGIIPHAILEVKDGAGKVIYRRKPQTLGQVEEPAIIGMLNRMLRETLVSGTARRSDIPGHIAAGKTGTTQDYRDAWFVGYTGQLVTALWVGNDDGEPMKKVTGSGLPAELWADFMKQAHNGLKPQPLPGLNGDIPMDEPVSVAPTAPGHDDNPGTWLGASRQERSLIGRILGD